MTAPEAGRMLFIGSSVADVILKTPRLPNTGDDINLISQQVELGGCACNAFRINRLCGGHAALFSPIGNGVWGNTVRSFLTQDGITSLCPPAEEANGCCYCLVEPFGERTFLCEHGAEYRFKSAWFDTLGNEVFHSVYLCGLEVEEPTGGVILDYLERHPPERLYFAPGPRICHIHPMKIARLFRLSPILHLNLSELLSFTMTDTTEEGAEKLLRLTDSALIITLGADGSAYADANQRIYVPAVPTEVIDTIGAGDAHVGAVMAARWRGFDWERCLQLANMVSAAVVANSGAGLTRQAMSAWLKSHPDSERDFILF